MMNRMEVINPRPWCALCRRALVNCYCAMAQPHDSTVRFAILIHPREARHRLGTGRMAHRMLANSTLIEGVDFTENDEVNRLIGDPAHHPLLLFPSREAIDLTKLTVRELQGLAAGGRTPVIFVLDGTWKGARKMLRLSENLRRLPAIGFDPPAPSAYGFRREPNRRFLSTIEAIQYVSSWFADSRGGAAARLLEPFHAMVAAQVGRSPS
jgi:DTW domain-containing protein YfiP